MSIQGTSTFTFTWPCSLCGGRIRIINGERVRHVCKLPEPDPDFTDAGDAKNRESK